MSRSAPPVRFLSFVLALGFIVPAGAQDDGAPCNGSLTPISASSASMTAMQSEIDELRRRLDVLDWDNQQPYDAPVYPSLLPSWVVSVDYLNWDLRQRSGDFAITTDDSALAVGQGSVHRLEMDRNSGVRGRLAYQTRVGWELGVAYTYFRTTGVASAEEPADGNLWATRSHPARYEEAGTADASGMFSFSVLDLEARYPVIQRAHADVSLFGGVRWAELDQEFLFRYDRRDFRGGQFRDNTSMSGFGLRMGAETHWWWNSSWGVFGNMSGSLLYGQFRTQLFESDCQPDCQDIIVQVYDRYGQAVPALDAAVGLAWNCGRFQVRGGYEMVNWFNFADRSMFPDETHEGAYSPQSTDVLLDGFFLRLTFRH
jgi:hypothetical protein